MKPTIAALQLTKLYRSPVPRDLVRRARLIDQLNRGPSLPLTLVSASAGSGNTTLLSDWLATCPCPSAWLLLDKEDIELLRHSSQTLHLVLASRSDPALPLARLRARGQMLEIRGGSPACTWWRSTCDRRPNPRPSCLTWEGVIATSWMICWPRSSRAPVPARSRVSARNLDTGPIGRGLVRCGNRIERAGC